MTRDPELMLAATCCRWPPSPGRDAAIRAGASGIHWDRFQRIIRRHRVEGLVAQAFSVAAVAPPPQVVADLTTDAAAIARQNLLFAAEALRIARLFEAAAVPFLFVKGATLDLLAYGSLGLKRSRDIDVAIAPDALGAACALLAEADYERVVPGSEVTPANFPIWIRYCKETAWRHRRTGIMVELHNGIVDNPELLQGISVYSSRQLVEIGPGIHLPTFTDADLFAYLCVHGAGHAWSRLKWLADLAAFLARFQPDQIEAAYRYATARGSGRSAAQALLLCAELLDTKLPADLRAELRSDRIVRLLVATAKRVMGGETELDETVLGTVPIHISHLLLGAGLRFKLSELRRKMRNSHDRSVLALPPWLRFLYPLVAVPRWVARRIKGATPL